MMTNWAELAGDLERLLRLRTFPLAWKLLEREEDLEKIRRVRRMGHRSTFCQIVTLARTAGWTLGATADPNDMWCSFASISGLFEGFWEETQGISRVGMYVKTEEDYKKLKDAMPRIPAGKFKALVVAPLSSQKFDPDIVLVHGNPAQMIILINGLQWTDYERLQFFCVGESSCADAFAQCYLSRKPALAIPCYGERRFGHFQDDELVMALPAAMVEKAIEGLKALSALGIRYPIVPYGCQVDPTEALDQAVGKNP